MNIYAQSPDTKQQLPMDDQAELMGNSLYHQKQSLTSVGIMPTRTTSSSCVKPHTETEKEQQNRALIAAALERYKKSLFQSPNQLTLPCNHATSSRHNNGNTTMHSKPAHSSENNENEHLRHLGRRQSKADAQKQRTSLPNDHDVLFGRAKSQKRHPGNNYLRQLCDNYRPHYDRAGRKDKMQLSKTIVDVIKSRDGCFLKFDHGLKRWFRVSDEEAQQKVGHMLRDGRSQELTVP